LKSKLFGLASVGLKSVLDKTNEWVQANGELIASGVEGFITGLVADVNSLVDHIDEGVAIVRNFKDGVVDAFEDSAVVKTFGVALKALFGGDSNSGPRIQAYLLGHELANVGIALVAFSTGVKVARGAVFLFEIGIKAVRLITIAWEATVAFVKGTIALYSAVTEIGAANTVAFGAAMTESEIAAGALALEEEGLAVATGEVAVAAEGAEVGLAGMGVAAGVALAPIAAVAAALAAVALAGYEAAQFMNENGGLEGAKGFLGLSDNSNNWGFQGVDDVMNDQARKEAAQREAGKVKFSDTTQGAPMAQAYDQLSNRIGGVAPVSGGYAAQFMAPPGGAPPIAPPASPLANITPDQLKQSVEITIKTDGAATAEVSKRPSGAKVNVRPSGSL
jgi:hypothetical protein